MTDTVMEPTHINLNSQLERWIDQRTGSRVYGLHVESNKRRVVVQGRTHTYYVRQLALAAVLEALETREFGPREQVEMEIEVGSR